MYFYNSGTIASGSPFALSIANYDAASPYGNTYVTNTGTISGGWLGVGTNYANFGNVTVHITGLPTIQPTLSGGSGSNTLVFNFDRYASIRQRQRGQRHDWGSGWSMMLSNEI